MSQRKWAKVLPWESSDVKTTAEQTEDLKNHPDDPQNFCDNIIWTMRQLNVLGGLYPITSGIN